MTSTKRIRFGRIAAYTLSSLMLLTALASLLGVISLRIVQTNSMQGTINQGDLVVSANWLKPSIGEIAIYHGHDLQGNRAEDVVHRVIAGNAEAGYTFQGDNNLSADPQTVTAKDVVGVVNFWIPGSGKLTNPLLILVIVSLIAVIYFGRDYIKSGFKKSSEWLATRGRFTKAVARTALSLISLWLVVTGLALAGIAKFEHPQVGPQLAVGSSNQSLVLVVPHSAIKVGDLAMATVAGHKNLVRVEAIKGHVYTVSSNIGKLLISSADVEGPIRFVVPFIGALWLPFD
jgi:hypothetical protein